MKHWILALLTAAAFSPAAAQAEMSAAQKAEIEALVKEYILNNGQILIESVNNFQKKQEEEANKQAEVKAKELLASLKGEKMMAATGNPDGDVTIVEFFDYNCGYCKKAYDEIVQLLKEDKNVHVVFYDMPILGPESVEAARWSLAAKKQDKYFDYHVAIMNHVGAKNEETYKELAEKAGLDAEKLAKDKASPAIEEEIQKHIQMAQDLGIQGTPGFLINETIFRGYIPYDVMKEAIKDARAKTNAKTE